MLSPGAPADPSDPWNSHAAPVSPRQNGQRGRIDQPLFSKKTNRRFENFTRVETFGDPETHWVRVTVDPADPQLFRFNAEIIPKNVVNHRK